MKRNIPYYRNQFFLNKKIIFLNHGSFGATPKSVFSSYQRWQRELEYQPVEFLGRRQYDLLKESRSRLSKYLGTDTNNIVYITNTTVGLNIVANSINLSIGEEVLTSNHEYGAMDKMWQYQMIRKGFTYRIHTLPLPLTSSEEFIDSLWGSVTPKTRVIFLSHITSPTAMIFPINEICKRSRDAGIITIIDGAHAPGQIDINLERIGADFYVGNLHKWLCAPKGSAFLYARPEVQHLLYPLIVSWGWQSDKPSQSKFIDNFEYTGTRDIAAFLTVPDAIKYQNQHQWEKVRNYCHFLVSETQQRISDLTGLQPFHSNIPSWYSQMGASPLPTNINCDVLKTRLYDDFHIEIPIIEWEKHKIIRYSFQAYNTIRDVNILLFSLNKLLNDSYIYL